ncbi:MAG: DUF5677 domain-containing protein [Coprobacillus sp.]|nr:DUF5677 domain-containing protein [Coprobacillus sp.]
MRIIELSKSQFHSFLKRAKVVGIDEDYAYDVYHLSCDIIRDATQADVFGKYETNNPVDQMFYVVGEVQFYFRNIPLERRESVKKDDDLKQNFAIMVADKYLSLSFFKYSEKRFSNKYLPQISTIQVYLNFFLNTLQSLSKNNPRVSLVLDIFNKSVKLASTSISLLVEGHESEAFSGWRTLHECECILLILDKYGDDAVDAYNRHILYGQAYRNFYDKETTDKIFVDIKKQMKDLGLKSKDMKKWIEYGWIKEINALPDEERESLHLNFRDGVEKLSGLEECSKDYDLSSELIHSTPTLIYKDDLFFYFKTLTCVYSTFFRLEEMFYRLYQKSATPEAIKSYEAMRKVYIPILQFTHETNIKDFNEYNQNRARVRKNSPNKGEESK